jgi:NADPH:quinone reductase-like Zn-dependent oxidoreductase
MFEAELPQSREAHGLSMLSLPRAHKKYVDDHIKGGHLRPRIAKTFHFEDVVEAYQYLESNRQIGKVVLTVGS